LRIEMDVPDAFNQQDPTMGSPNAIGILGDGFSN
jgi:hypothetical protein